MSTEESYGVVFDNYIAAGANVSLARVQNLGDRLSEAERRQAWHTLSYALALDSAWPAARDLLLALAPKMVQAGYREEWLPYLETGIKQSQAQGDCPAEADLSLYLGHLHQRLGRLDRADQYVADAERLFQDLENPVRLGATLNRRAEIARGRRDFGAAIRLTDSALVLLTADPITADFIIDSGERGHSYLIKGRVAFNQQKWSLAGQNFEIAAQAYERANLPHRLAVCIQNLGRVRTMESDYDSAVVHFERAVGLLETANDVFNLAVVQMNLGVVHSLCNRPLQSLEQYAKAEPVFRRLQDRTHMAKIFNNQGMEMNNLERWADAEQLLQASSALCLQLDDLQEYINAQDSLGLTYMGSGDFAGAINVYERALALSKERVDQDFTQSTLSDLTKHLERAKQAREACT